MRMGEYIREDPALEVLYDHIVTFVGLGGDPKLYPLVADLEDTPS